MSIFEKLRNYCKTEYISRSQLQTLTGGIITGNTMSKFDSLGIGIKNRKIIGKRTAYHIDDVIRWLEENTARIR